MFFLFISLLSLVNPFIFLYRCESLPVSHFPVSHFPVRCAHLVPSTHDVDLCCGHVNSYFVLLISRLRNKFFMNVIFVGSFITSITVI